MYDKINEYHKNWLSNLFIMSGDTYPHQLHLSHRFVILHFNVPL